MQALNVNVLWMREEKANDADNDVLWMFEEQRNEADNNMCEEKANEAAIQRSVQTTTQ